MSKTYFTSERKMSNLLFIDEYLGRLKKLKKIEYENDNSAINSVHDYFSYNSKSMFQVY